MNIQEGTRITKTKQRENRDCMLGENYALTFYHWFAWSECTQTNDVLASATPLKHISGKGVRKGIE